MDAGRAAKCRSGNGLFAVRALGGSVMPPTHAHVHE